MKTGSDIIQGFKIFFFSVTEIRVTILLNENASLTYGCYGEHSRSSENIRSADEMVVSR